MTGIFYCYQKNKNYNEKLLENAANSMKHRGEEEEFIFTKPHSFLKVFLNCAQNCHNNIELLNENNKDPTTKDYCVIDGDIFNQDELISKYCIDTEKNIERSIINGYKLKGQNFFRKLEGMFSLLLIIDNEVIAVKDPIGYNPLYILDSDDLIIICSELKALKNFEGEPFILQPGSQFRYFNNQSEINAYFSVEELKELSLMSNKEIGFIKNEIFTKLKHIVKQNVEGDFKVSSLLSGGIDSTVICALAQRYIPKLDVYTCYAKGSPDIAHAKNFSEMYPNVNHHIFEISIEDMLEIIPKVIYHLETFDAALIRSAIPMYYICSKVDNETDVLLTGEGGDELFGGYDYLKDFSSSELNDELVDLLKVEHATGLQRVDRIPYAFGIEARAPWFDFNLTKYSFKIPASLKIKEENNQVLEKWIMRETFKDIIPNSVYERKKAKFSKGVGSQFFIRDYCNKMISDEEFEKEKEIYTDFFLKNKEELYYWRIFKEKFNPNQEFVKKMPRTEVFIL